jgi:hypothetical protein
MIRRYLIDPPAFVLMYALILVSREAQFMLGWRHK